MKAKLPNKPLSKEGFNLTAGQAVAWDIFNELVEGKRDEVEWCSLTDEIAAKATVKNWMTIRSILQRFLNDGVIKRPPFDPVAPELYIRAESGDVLDPSFRSTPRNR